MSDYLAHHGVLGQKWGVRRYRNYDGTRTEEGKARRRRSEIGLEERVTARYKKPLNKVDADWKRKETLQKSSTGVRKKSDTDDVLLKGSKLKRYSTASDEGLRNPTYVAVTKNDRHVYGKMADDGDLGGERGKEIYEYSLEAIDDLRIANGKAVADHIFDTYGDEDLKSKWTEYNALKIRDNYDRIFKDMTKNKLHNDEGRYAQQLRDDIFGGLHEALYRDKDRQQEILDHFAKKGYDAVVDAEDWAGGFSYPLIVMNTNKLTIKHVNRRRKSHD